MSRRWVLLVLALALAAAACAATPDLGSHAEALPDETTFAPVSVALLQRCGSIDCHGSPYRNLRLRGFGGARLNPNDRPDAPETTSLEESGNFDAVVGLEPDIMNDVINDHGKSPDRLTLVRKGRNQEAHKGGQRMVPGDAADLCLTSWLAGAVDESSCQRVANTP